MALVVTAVFEDGVFKPDVAVNLPPQARVRLTVEIDEPSAESRRKALEEMERIWREVSVDSGGDRMTRDQLRPDESPNLPARARVRLVIEPLGPTPEERERAWKALLELRSRAPVHSGEKRVPREQLYDRG
jgi:predicted DNA-binding antitoxin AbrB/MazE fold protein